MSETVVNKPAIVKFVREGLGCTCPDEIFDCISVEPNPGAVAYLPQGNLLMIGERLLVYVIKTKDWASAEGNLEQIFSWGRKKRDAGKFNRFRLVVATPDYDPAQQTLSQEFDCLVETDARLHLHVIRPEHLPEFLFEDHLIR